MNEYAGAERCANAINQTQTKTTFSEPNRLTKNERILALEYRLAEQERFTKMLFDVLKETRRKVGGTW